MDRDVVVVGGGPAGTAAAVLLAELGHDVVLAERKDFPRHKLCGEFISHESVPLLKRLGVYEAIRDSGAVELRSVVLTEMGGDGCSAPLPTNALGVSRLLLDELLIRRAEQVGVDVRQPVEVTSITGDMRDGFRVALGAGSPASVPPVAETCLNTAVVIGAWGRQSRLARKLRSAQNETLPGERDRTSPWVAFKGHYEGGDVGDRIELHAFRRGYCGMSHVEGSLLNACWIVHRDELPRGESDLNSAFVKTLFATNPVLSARFSSMQLTWDKLLSVSQLHFDARSALIGDVMLAGDAAGMIAPLCGDGMSMALMSGSFLASEASDFLSGRQTAADFKRRYARAWRSGFSRRMWLGRSTHGALTNARRARIAVATARRYPRAFSWVINQTRGYPSAMSRPLRG